MAIATSLDYRDLNITVYEESDDPTFPTGADYALTVTGAVLATIQVVQFPTFLGAILYSKLSEPLKVTGVNTCISGMVCSVALYLLAFRPFSPHFKSDRVACLATETFQLIAISGNYLAVLCHSVLALLVVEKPFIQTSFSRRSICIFLVGIWTVDIVVILCCLLGFVTGSETPSDKPSECTYSSIPKSAIYFVDCGIAAPATIASCGTGARTLYLAMIHRRRIESVNRAVVPSFRARPEYVTCMTNCIVFTIAFVSSACHTGLLFLLHLSVFSDATMSVVNRTLFTVFYGVNFIVSLFAYYSKVMKDGFRQCIKKWRRDIANCFGS